MTPRLTRGLGVTAGLVALGGVGLADGLLAWSRAPRGSLPPSLGLLVVLQCAATLLSLGIGLGLLEELILYSARTVPWLCRVAGWLLAGPRRWFARDPDRAAGLAALAIGVAIALGPLYPVSYTVQRTFHSKSLAALAIFLAPFAFAAVASVLLLLLSGPMRWLFHRLGRLASPGVVLSVTVVAVAAQTVRFFALNWAGFRNLEFGAVALLGALLVANGLALLLLGRRVVRRAAPLRRRVPLALSIVSVAAIVTSAFTLGARQTVAATLFNRSLLAQRVARTLQLSLDFDGDGYSAVFNGGDCNDRDARVSPRAHDVPGNGRDENCSGRDARLESEESTGHLVPLPPEAPQQPPSFVLLSIDAMRPDHLGSYGYRRPTTPNIDRFARGAARFTNAYCASPRSLRSFGSLWVGRYASLVSWGNDVQFPPLELSNVTLAEQLSSAGYLTAAFPATAYFSHTAGFFQGFQQVVEEPGFKPDAAPAVARMQAFLREHENDPQPFFMWSHIMETHDPYRDRTEPRDFGHSQMDQYDEELAGADAAIAPLLTQLDELAAKRPLVVILFGDHGEAFGEHGVYHHSFDLHDEALRVPIIVRAPGVTPGSRHALTNLFDLNPTLLNFAGRPPVAPVSGRSLLPVLYDPSPGSLMPPGWRRWLFAEVTPDGLFPSEQKSIYAPPFKLIHDLRRGTWELFDISRDRGEIRNLYDDRPELAAELRERLVTWTDHGALATNRSNEQIAAARLRSEPAMQHPLHVRFGDVAELLGYDLPADSVPIDGTYRAVLYWRVLRRTRVPVYIVVSFDPVDAQPIWPLFVARHAPIYGRYPTTEWRPGEILRDEVSLRVDPEMRPVRLRTFVSLEVEGDGRRIGPEGVNAPDDRLEIAPVEITPRAP
ncbi:MAG: sulfatase-like hydrolase/transferase [Deltaproteobacteria bacterium]|nr:sulfatase-like hydrolase/transferase [Deltaproteobacteria bacterium]